MRTLTLISCLFIGTSFCFADTIHVPADQGSIQAAINMAANGDQIIVAPGTYFENINFSGKAVSVESSGGPEVTIIDGSDAWSVVMFHSGEGSGSVLEGFTLTNGHGWGAPDYIGGGITCKYSSPTIRDNIISNNKAGVNGGYGNGGGIYMASASPLITECEITLNLANFDGGAIYCRDGSTPVISNNEITWNVAKITAGAIYCCYGSSPTITGNLLANNAATDGCMGWGGGVGCYDDSSPLISGNVITHNLVYKHGGGVSCKMNSNPIIEYNIICGNTASRSGGAILAEDSSPLINGNLIAGNQCNKYGGGIWLVNSASTVSNNLIVDNLATGTYGGFGGGICCTDASGLIVNNTLYGNQCDQHGGGICFYGNVVPQVSNTILWGDYSVLGTEIYVGTLSAQAAPSLNYSNVQGGLSSVYIVAGNAINWGAGMLDRNPLFVDADGPDNDIGTWEDNDFHLTSGSPLINMGSNLGCPVTDRDLEARPEMGTADIGCDEFVGLHRLESDSFLLPITGGSVHFTLNGGTLQAGRTYLILGGFSGKTPGIPLPGGYHQALPCNWDGFTDYLLMRLNTPSFQQFLGTLDGLGNASATLNLPGLPAKHLGKVISFGFCLEGSPWNFVSNSIDVELVP